MAAQRVDLLVERLCDVDVRRRAGVAAGHDPDLAHGPRLEPIVGEGQVRVRVAGVRIHRAERGLAGGQVIGMRRVDPFEVAFG